MRNDEKIDIQLEETVSEDMGAKEKAERHYETAQRYIGISKFMKKYEDRDKYLHRGIRYMKKCYPALDVRKELKELRLQLFQLRAQGRVDLYEEALSVLESAKNEKDYNAAMELFKRIHKHEQTHSIPENLVDPELYAKVKAYSDSEERMQYCEQQIDALNAKAKRKTRVVSGILLVILLALLLFSKTLTFHKVLGQVLETAHAYSFAYQRYEHVYGSLTEEDEKAKYLEKSSECHYKEAQKALDAHNKKLALKEYSICVARNYKDSAQKLYELELAKIDSAKIGSYVNFGGNGKILWKVLAKDGNRALLYKKYGLDEKDKPAYHTEETAVTWESCNLRNWLNTSYFERTFTDQEKAAIPVVTVPADDNPKYGTSGGNDTQDRMYILSATEYKQYFDLFPQTETASWLRTPGSNQVSACIVNRYKTIMEYGYEVSNKHFTIKPIFWVEFK